MTPTPQPQTGCTPQACTCPDLRLRKQPAIIDISKVLEQHPQHALGSQQEGAAVFIPGEREVAVAVIGESDIRLAHQLPGKPREGQAHHPLFDKPSRWKCSDLKVRMGFPGGSQ